MAKMAKAPARRRARRSFKKKEKRVVHTGVAHIQATFNNTHRDHRRPGGQLAPGRAPARSGFQGSRKGTPFAAQQAAMTAANKAEESGLRSVEVRVNGPGSGRESAVRALQAAGMCEIRVRSARTSTADSAQRLPAANKRDEGRGCKPHLREK